MFGELSRHLSAPTIGVVILDSLTIDSASFAAATGWVAKPEGMCKDDVCVPLSTGGFRPNETGSGELDLAVVAERLQMPLVHDESAGIWALGPQAGGQALTSAVAADLELPDADGNTFKLSALHGRKVLLVAWASW